MEHNQSTASWAPSQDSKRGMGPRASTDTSITGNPDGCQLEPASLLGEHLRYTPTLCSPTAGGTVALCYSTTAAPKLLNA